MATKKQQEPSTEIARVDFNNEDHLREIMSFEDAFKAAVESYGGVDTASDFLGSGFTVLNKDEKEKLINVPFIILLSRFHMGDQGEFCSLIVVTQENERFIINDGGTGIYAQAKSLKERTGRDGGWMVTHGLRDSDYPTCFNCSKPRGTMDHECKLCGDTSEKRGRGRTFYLDA